MTLYTALSLLLLFFIHAAGCSTQQPVRTELRENTVQTKETGEKSSNGPLMKKNENTGRVSIKWAAWKKIDPVRKEVDSFRITRGENVIAEVTYEQYTDHPYKDEKKDRSGPGIYEYKIEALKDGRVVDTFVFDDPVDWGKLVWDYDPRAPTTDKKYTHCVVLLEKTWEENGTKKVYDFVPIYTVPFPEKPEHPDKGSMGVRLINIFTRDNPLIGSEKHNEDIAKQACEALGIEKAGIDDILRFITSEQLNTVAVAYCRINEKGNIEEQADDHSNKVSFLYRIELLEDE